MNSKIIVGLENIPKNKKDVIVVVDAFRSSATINHAFYNDVRKVLLFNNEKEICAYSKKRSGLLCGEKNGYKIKGFDLGNCPQEYINLKNKTILFTSGFGAKAILKANAKKVYLAGLTNIEFISHYLNKTCKDKTIYFVISGKKNSICMDDFITTGIIIAHLDNLKKLDSFSKIALNLVIQYEKYVFDLIYNSLPAKALINSHFKKDILFCIYSKFNIIPYKNKNELKKVIFNG